MESRATPHRTHHNQAGPGAFGGIAERSRRAAVHAATCGGGMTAKQLGESLAFPLAESIDQYAKADGMTKREYAAVAAMQGYLATWGESAVHEFDVASKAVKCADALLAELAKEQS